MRVIAGQYRSRPLRSLRGMDIRPTADRLRESLFDVLTAGNPGALDGCIWIDALKALRQLEENGIVANVVFLDPPYRMDHAYGDALEFLEKSALVNEATIVIAEHQKRTGPGEQFGTLRRYRKLTQGEGVLSFYRRTRV